MPSEVIGDISTGQMPEDRDWIVFWLETAAEYLRFVIGQPEGYRIEILWHDHDVGSYPNLGVTWEHPLESPGNWLHSWEIALAAFNQSIAWKALRPDSIDEAIAISRSVSLHDDLDFGD